MTIMQKEIYDGLCDTGNTITFDFVEGTENLNYLGSCDVRIKDEDQGLDITVTPDGEITYH